ncbi:bifunctional nicotinamide mononucleotide adenylyltransferase/ADP-ribose pyrophosphatase [uncultured Caudovirales phage]|uniref:Bifunctional nicotinamide mononucleotide adenylyltransferase/ADP-ribose pyrophosphatase n=1 Tax=uncultured Caudovirales phage TaxID=2100421 RepID=A0A6J5NUQ8_9CAUD|nr:bifunctional nicotinamide mononucleotide adenylyltransferase/ADP-ribose pyrophosphatase [uncultured Caudovirales phage]
MAKQYDTIVYIGRFQPFHNAHVEIIRRAGLMTKRLVVIVGSAFQPRTFKNPFTEVERESMIFHSIKDRDFGLKIRYNTDTIYNDQAWAIRIQNIVNECTMLGDKIAIIGHKKDESTFYLDMFPQWDFIDQDLIEPLNATNVRDLYFRKNCNMNFIKSVVPEVVFKFLVDFKDTKEYNQIIREREFVEQYKKQFAHLPYEPTFVTVDNVVIQSGHVLMIRRRAEPGKGLWALPGGFLNATTDRSVMHGAIRELKEETGIKVPVPVLVGSIKDNKVFDAIDRSARGRTITHAFKIVLPDGPLPKVKGLDDADKAKWIPIANVDSSECFEDHYEILQHFVGG